MAVTTEFWLCVECGYAACWDGACPDCAGMLKKIAGPTKAADGPAMRAPRPGPATMLPIEPGAMWPMWPGGVETSTGNEGTLSPYIVERRSLPPVEERGIGIAALALKAPARARPLRHETKTWDPYGVTLPDAEAGRYGWLS